MNRIQRFQFRHSIRMRLLAISIGLALATMALVSYLALNSIRTTGERATQSGEQSLRNQTEDFLLTQVIETADRDNLQFEKIAQDAGNLASFAARIFDNPNAFSQDSYWLTKNHMFTGPDGQYINGKNDISTVFVPNFVEINDALIQELELTAYLDMIFPAVFNDNPNTVAVYTVIKSEIGRLYPNISLGTILPGDYSMVNDIFFSSGAPENNPGKNIVWTPVYDDPAGQGLMVSVVAPIYTSNDEFIGIIGIDISLAEITASIETKNAVSGGYSFIVDQDGRALALPDQGYADILGRPRGVNEFGPDLKAATSTFMPVIANATTGETKFQSVMANGKEFFVTFAPMPATGWARVNVFEAEKMLTAVSALKTELDASTRTLIFKQLLPLGAIIFIAVFIVGIALTNRLINPLQKLAESAQRIGAGEWDAPLPQGGQDEIGALSTAIREMVRQIRASFYGLEQRAADRTRDLEIVAEVGTATSTILNTDKLLQEVVDLTKERFNLYHAHIYLFDEAGKNLELASGAGEAGRQMVAEGHSISLNRERSLVARAAREQHGVIVNDVTQAPDFLPNPLLPDTRSELAVPMIVAGNTIGVLDIQSSQVGHFTEADVNIQTTLAAQLAASIQNVRSFEQAKTQADFESLVNAIGQKIQRAATVEETLQIAVREIGIAMDARVKAEIQSTAQVASTEPSATD